MLVVGLAQLSDGLVGRLKSPCLKADFSSICDPMEPSTLVLLQAMSSLPVQYTIVLQRSLEPSLLATIY